MHHKENFFGLILNKKRSFMAELAVSCTRDAISTEIFKKRSQHFLYRMPYEIGVLRYCCPERIEKAWRGSGIASLTRTKSESFQKLSTIAETYFLHLSSEQIRAAKCRIDCIDRYAFLRKTTPSNISMYILVFSSLSPFDLSIDRSNDQAIKQ